MKVKECTWQHGDVEFRLRTESNQDRHMVYLSVDHDVSIAETNPISIHIRLDALTALNEKFYVIMIGGITVRNIPEEAAKEISKTLDEITGEEMPVLVKNAKNRGDNHAHFDMRKSRLMKTLSTHPYRLFLSLI